ncbi:unnamed protein product [Arctogadus glacialis]
MESSAITGQGLAQVQHMLARFVLYDPWSSVGGSGAAEPAVLCPFSDQWWLGLCSFNPTLQFLGAPCGCNRHSSAPTLWQLRIYKECDR